MAEERTLGLARARESLDDETSKDALQRRMEETRDSITNTVTEIKDTVAQRYEDVKDALDWREHFKRRPLAWTLGAAGVGFFVGYGIAAALTEDDYDEEKYAPSTPHAYAAQPVIGEPLAAAISAKTDGKDEGPGMLERFRETSAYEKLSKEAGALGDRLIEELSTAAQVVVLPALLKKIKNWIGVDLSDKKHQASMGGSQPVRSRQEASSSTYQPVLERSS